MSADLRVQRNRERDRLQETIPGVIPQLVEMTNDLIPGEIRVEDGTDPEYPDMPSIVFRVTAKDKPLDVNALIDKEIEWHRAARKIIPTATCYFSVSID